MEKYIGGILLFVVTPVFAGECSIEVGTGTFSIGSINTHLEEGVLDFPLVSGNLSVRTKSHPRYSSLNCDVGASWRVRFGYIENMSASTELTARVSYHTRGFDFVFGRSGEISGPRVSVQRVLRMGDVDAALGLGIMRATGVLGAHLDTKYGNIEYTEVHKKNLPFIDMSVGYKVLPGLSIQLRHERYAPRAYSNLIGFSYEL